MKGAFFLDRDGTINPDPGYIRDPEMMELLPGVAQAIRSAMDAGYSVVVVTNQSGVGRGIIPEDALKEVHGRLNELLFAQSGAEIEHFAACLHAPSENCECRKPLPKLVLDAANQLKLDIGKSVFIGDRLTDIATGKRAGCRYSILVRTGDGQAEEEMLASDSNPDEDFIPHFVADDLAQAVKWALANFSR